MPRPLRSTPGLALATLALLTACTRSSAPEAGASPSSSSSSPPAPPLTASSAPAPAAVLDPITEGWIFWGLSADGKRALLQLTRFRHPALFHLRVVEVDTGAVVDDVELAELGKLPYQGPDDDEVPAVEALLRTPAFEADLVRAAGIYRGFGLQPMDRFAAAPDGSAIAFNVGDWVYVADGQGRVKRRLSTESSYEPWFAPDGKHVFFRRMNGVLDSIEARYETFVAPTSGATPPRRLAGTAETNDHVTLSPDGKAAFHVASRAPQVKTCVLSIGVTPPFTVGRVACLEGIGDAERHFQLDSAVSPGGRWAAVCNGTAGADGGPDGERAARCRAVRLADGKVVFDASVPGWICAMSDLGTMLFATREQRVTLVDASTGATRTLAGKIALGFGARFRGEGEIVILRNERFEVIDLARAP